MSHRSTLTAIPVLILLFLADHSKAQSATDIGWPRQVTKNGSVLLYYQPQIDEWKDYKQLSARMAFSLTPANGRQLLGIASFTCGTLVDKDARTVYLRDLQIPDVRFPQLSADSVKLMEQLFKQLAPSGGEPFSLDRIMADMKQQNQVEQGVPVRNDPPKLFYSSNPAVLLMVEGDPVLAPIEKTNLQFVVNTNWDLFQDKKKKDYYLLLNTGWMTSKALEGSWTPTQSLPKDMSKLPAGGNFDEVKKMVPPPPPSGTVPQVFYSNVPAELILLKGAPVYSRISGTQLLYVANSDNDIFIDDASKTFYILLSGRWFRSAALSGPWTYAGNDLPRDFAKIPASSPKAGVLASVPGTIQASDAVMLAQIPTTAIVNKAEVEAKVNVSYDGDPAFKPIEKTSMEYATNTQDKVIKVGDLYYLCFQAVWFMSTKPTGPWKTADAVPSVIYTIPPSSPVYNVTYVTQTNATPTTVESSSSGGYLGMFIIGMAVGACIAYGTGYYYPPYIYFHPGMPYPIYRPWPCTYGIGAVYNPMRGGWAAGRTVYGPYGAARSSAWYNPATGRYGRSASVQGWYGGRTAASSYNPWTGGYASTRQGHNTYSQWGSSVASRGNQWVQTGHVTTAAGTVSGFRTSSGQAGVVTHGANGTHVRTNNNNVYAGHDGNVYKKNNNGNWSQYGKGGWQQPVGASQSTMHGLGSSDQARRTGQTQTNRFQNSRPAGGRGGGIRRR
ncbi:MAG TPA: hypothetical protein VGN00_05910 [Puia sp.]